MNPIGEVDSIVYIILAILVFGILIFVHELGHFLAAKWLGVQVNEFAICMGPAIFQKKIGETTYSLRCIPIGGYCAMEGEDEDSQNPRAFTSVAKWRRVIILAAGSFMNLVIGLLFLVIFFSQVVSYTSPTIAGFYEGCPYESQDGLQPGDTFYKIDGERVYIYQDIGTLLSRNQTGVYDLVIRRDGKLVELPNFKLEKQSYEVEGQTVELYGFLFQAEDATFSRTLQQAWLNGIDFVRLVRLGLEDLFTGNAGIQDMSGPVGIVNLISETGKSSQSIKLGILNVLYICSFLAINLAVMNMLPLPALDGGRIFCLLLTAGIEAILGRRLNPKYEGYAHGIGMVLLMGLMIFVTFQDIFRIAVS